VYRFCRDLDYAIGALQSGMIADALSVGAAIHVVAAIRFASGLVSLAMMRAQQPRRGAKIQRAAVVAPCDAPGKRVRRRPFVSLFGALPRRGTL